METLRSGWSGILHQFCAEHSIPEIKYSANLLPFASFRRHILSSIMGFLSELPLPASMDPVLPPAILKALAVANPYIILIGLLVLTLITVSSHFKKRQILVPDIPIVGGSDKESVLRNRNRFIHDGKAMLLEGYRKVSTYRHGINREKP